MSTDRDESPASRYLLEGRRVQLRDLLAAGLLMEGDRLFYELRKKSATHFAVATADGHLRLEDGRVFRTPSRAAAAAANVSAVDGWHAWVLSDSGASLDALRRTLLDRAASDDLRDSGSPVQEGRGRRFELLKAARVAADEKDPVKLPVRDLLQWWAAASRGSRVTKRIEADLANHGLGSWPDFRKVSLDAIVELRALTDLEQPDDADMVQDTAALPRWPANGAPQNREADLDDDEGDIPVGGITVGNLPSASLRVVSVPPDSSFEEAITLMLLNDFSQLAVLSGRQLRGAVTWRSIAQARNANPAAAFADAITEARAVNYDRELIDCLGALEDEDFFFVLNESRAISGIVTTADVVHAYGELASPFLLIGELDRALRRVVSRTFSLDQIQAVCDLSGTRRLGSYDELSLGDYQQVLGNPDLWQKLGWALDRRAFGQRLDELREFRNDIMHFNPDPVPPEMVGRLRHFIQLVRSYCDG